MLEGSKRLREGRMDDVIEILKMMGATDVQYRQVDGSDDTLAFDFRGHHITLRAVHCNDSTAGLEGERR